MAGDEAHGRAGLAQRRAGELDGGGLVGLVAEDHDLDRPVVRDERCRPSGMSNARLIAPGPGQKLSWSPRQTYIGVLPIRSPSGRKMLRSSKRLGGDEVGVVAGRHGELGSLRGEHAADGPLVVVARAVVGEHGEAHGPVERAGRRRERPAGLRRAVDARGPGVARVRAQAAQDTARDLRRASRPARPRSGRRSCPSRTRQRSAASLSETRSRYGPRVKGVSEGPRRYDIQYQIVTPTAITQTATIRPSAASASRARVSRRWRISSLAIPAR